MTTYYHITFETLEDRQIVEADVKAEWDGSDILSIHYQRIVITDQKTRKSVTADFMPEEYVSEADYEAEGKFPLRGESNAVVEDRWDHDLLPDNHA